MRKMRLGQVLVFMLLVSLFTLAACAAAGEAEYRFDAATGMLRDYKGSGGDVVTPADWEGQPVKVLGGTLYYRKPEITSLVVQAPVEVLSSGSIEILENATSVILPDTLRVMLVGNFQSMPKLESVTIPASVRYIDDGCFVFCDSLQSVTFLGEVPVILGTSFTTLENTVVYVPDDQLDAYLEVLPEKLQVLPSGMPAVREEIRTNPADLLFDAQTQTLTGYAGKSSVVVIPREIDGVPVRHIGERAFSGNKSVHLLTLPEGLETIQDYAFASCNALRFVDCPDTVRSIGAHAFERGFQGESFDWSAGLETIGESAFQNTALSHDLILPYGLKTIGDSAFEGIRWASVEIPETIEHIGQHAFANSYIEYVALDAWEMLDIADNAFENCSSLEDMDLPWDSSLENLRTYEAFMAPQAPDCTVWINNPPDVSYVSGDYKYELGEDDGFYLVSYDGDQDAIMLHYNAWDYSGEERVRKPVVGLGDGVFKGNSTLRRFRVTHSFTMKSIGAEAFADSALEEVDLFYSIETIGAGAFRNCKNLREITLPASLKFIGPGAFDGCDSLEKVTVLCDPSVVPSDAFAN